MGYTGVIVDAAYRIARRWAGTHIVVKVHKISKPTFTYDYASTPVSIVFLILWVEASTLHFAPRAMLGRMASAMSSCVSFLTKDFRHDFLVDAPATAVPHSISCVRNVVGAGKSRKATDFLSSQVNKWWHPSISPLFLVISGLHSLDKKVKI